MIAEDATEHKSEKVTPGPSQKSAKKIEQKVAKEAKSGKFLRKAAGPRLVMIR
jgi:hypothetical protein